jgi:hypothetical protein
MFKKKYSLLKYFGKSKLKKTLRKKRCSLRKKNTQCKRNKRNKRNQKSKKMMRGGRGGAPTIDEQKNL